METNKEIVYYKISNIKDLEKVRKLFPETWEAWSINYWIHKKWVSENTYYYMSFTLWDNWFIHRYRWSMFACNFHKIERKWICIIDFSNNFRFIT